ncbi:hypothetical protein ACQ4PT_010239 [Festuca glaucescens]
MLSRLRHPNIVDLIGYCADDHHRILVHEFMPLGSLQYHLHDSGDKAARLDWNTRMKIAAGVAKGLGYLHEHGVMYGGMTCSNILLGDGYHPKLSEDSEIRMGKLEPGYLAPEILDTGSMQLDVYNFGVVLLRMITGRRVVDDSPAATA